MNPADTDLPRLTGHAVRDALRAREEIALLDVREEHPYAQEHPLFAAQLAFSRLELEAPWRLPRHDVNLVVYEDGEGLAVPAARRRQALAARAGAQRLEPGALAAPDPAGHLPGCGSAPGGQLVQETDVFAPVRGARLLLADDDGVRAPMTAHWLAQMGWDVAWVAGVPAGRFSDRSPRPAPPKGAVAATVTPAELAAALAAEGTTVIDLSPSATYVQRHLPGAWWALHSQAGAALRHIAAAEFADLAQVPVQVLEGGNAAWLAAGLPAEPGEACLASPRIDRYRRPCEGTDNPREAMQGYLDWEFGLVAQLGRDATHGFRVLGAAP